MKPSTYNNILPYGFTSVGQKHVRAVAGPGQLAIAQWGIFVPHIFTPGQYDKGRRRAFDIYNLTGMEIEDVEYDWWYRDEHWRTTFEKRNASGVRHPRYYYIVGSKRPKVRMKVGTVDVIDPFQDDSGVLTHMETQDRNATKARDQMIALIKYYESGVAS